MMREHIVKTIFEEKWYIWWWCWWWVFVYMKTIIFCVYCWWEMERILV